jgi:uncharacterized membrane protein YeaQ/YmgE (transglycosylase-associated protein family)
LAPWLSWILLGLIAGSLAKFLVPGRNLPGCVVTILLGTAGAFVGGLLSTALGWGTIGERLDARSILFATAGSLVVLLLARFLVSRFRPRPPDAR